MSFSHLKRMMTRIEVSKKNAGYGLIVTFTLHILRKLNSPPLGLKMVKGLKVTLEKNLLSTN